LKFITSKELRNNPAKAWQTADEETVVTVNGKPAAIIIGAGSDVEEQLKSIRRAKAQSALEKLRIYSTKRGLNKLTDEDIIAEVEKIRRNGK
jgi:antitoxin (DNA-binding transcriptional repressor) of toxin-antitoxin stability system